MLAGDIDADDPPAAPVMALPPFLRPSAREGFSAVLSVTVVVAGVVGVVADGDDGCWDGGECAVGGEDVLVFWSVRA